MTSFVKQIFKPALLILTMLCTSKVYAQISLFDNLINKIENYKSLSYKSVNKRRDMSADTTIALNNEAFLKAPNDKLFGYHYRLETNHTTEAFNRILLYDGKDQTILSLSDSTFFPSHEGTGNFDQSLIGTLKFLRNRYNKKTFKVTQLRDTVINGVTNSHIIANVYDTIENNEHLYSNRDYYLNKQTDLPSLVTIIGRYKYNGLVSGYYDETRYSDYKMDNTDINDSLFLIPKGFTPRQDKAANALLAVGTSAPDWTLFDANGKQTSLNDLKGKVVMMDFYYIGCSGCMASINPLKAIYEKYKNKGLVIASLTARDSKKAVLDFEKRYKISYSGYIGAADVVRSYNVTAFPTFYFIDKAGKIANVFVGYTPDFENKLNTIISKLLVAK
ncbi:TlpA family protein disulfide reductase [Mucilaginibacter lutimaris]|uniref:TlpA family protein disulfide reductase n=1 Tax=Mucilaginibacter lutimaris TaxID=931629 RepID=A0ABW2ZGB6_9SPHI